MRVWLTIFLLSLGSAQAAPVTWQLNDLAFTDGGTVSGTFTFDWDLPFQQRMSDVNITTSAGSLFAGDVYTSEGPEGAFYDPLGFAFIFYTDNFVGKTNETVVVLFPTVGPFGPGTTQPLPVEAVEFTCLDEGCPFNGTALRSGVSLPDGSISVVPLPASVWLFLSALTGLGWIKRKVGVV